MRAMKLTLWVSKLNLAVDFVLSISTGHFEAELNILYGMEVLKIHPIFPTLLCSFKLLQELPVNVM